MTQLRSIAPLFVLVGVFACSDASIVGDPCVSADDCDGGLICNTTSFTCQTNTSMDSGPGGGDGGGGDDGGGGVDAGDGTDGGGGVDAGDRVDGATATDGGGDAAMCPDGVTPMGDDMGRRWCAAGACYCADSDRCLPAVDAARCCASDPVCGDGSPPACVGSDPNNEGGLMFCDPGECRCVGSNRCFATAEALGCCGSGGTLECRAPASCMGEHPLLDAGARFCAPGSCFCANPDSCFPPSTAAECCIVDPVCF